MLASDAPNLSICRNVNALEFWHLRISKTFDKPEYYIGQTVLHKIKVSQGEILHPVMVVGLMWSGFDWEYSVNLPSDHPEFDQENHTWAVLNDWNLEPI